MKTAAMLSISNKFRSSRLYKFYLTDSHHESDMDTKSQRLLYALLYFTDGINEDTTLLSLAETTDLSDYDESASQLLREIDQERDFKFDFTDNTISYWFTNLAAYKKMYHDILKCKYAVDVIRIVTALYQSFQDVVIRSSDVVTAYDKSCADFVDDLRSVIPKSSVSADEFVVHDVIDCIKKKTFRRSLLGSLMYEAVRDYIYCKYDGTIQLVKTMDAFRKQLIREGIGMTDAHH